mgnify:CR=1 FL=1
MRDLGNTEIEHYETDFYRTDCSDCDPCHIGVSDSGCYQCTECRAIFGQADLQLVQAHLLRRYGLEDAQNEYARLKRIKSLVRQNQLSQLKPVVYDFRKENGDFKTDRYFF